MEIELGDPDTKTQEHRSERGKCADCPQWGKCLFHMPRYGGFKRQGKRYVGFRLITDAAENSNAREDFVSCVNFVEVFQDRMLTGQQLRAEGKAGEMITVLVGRDTVTQGLMVGFNTRNEIINPQPNQVEAMKEAGYKVNLEDRGAASRWEEIVITRQIPKWKEPDRAGRTTYSQQMAARQKDEERDELAAEELIWEQRTAKPKVDDDPEDFGEESGA